MISRTPKEFKPGDIIRHRMLTEAVGIIIKLNDQPEVDRVWDIFWISHPDEQIKQISPLSEFWIKHHRPYKRSGKTLDKSDREMYSKET